MFFTYGDVVRINDRDLVGVITKITRGKTPYKVYVEGKGSWSCNAVHITRVEGPEAEELKKKHHEINTNAFNNFCVGSVVEVEGREGYFVVTGPANGDNQMRVAKLGGDGNRYLRCYPAQVTLVKDFTFATR